MSEFHLRRAILTNPTSGTVATGASKVLYRIPRRSNRRLEKIELHANVTVGGTGGAGTASNRLEGLMSEIRFSASDVGASTRQVFKQSSATLLAWHYKHARQSSRYNQTAYGVSALGTYDVFVPLHFAHPSSPSPGAWQQTMPLWAQDSTGVGLGADPELEIDFSAINDANLGLAAGTTLTYNRFRVVLYMRDIGPGMLPYVPMVLETTQFDTGATGGAGVRFTYPKDGWLTSTMLENFSTPATGIRGSVLSSAADTWRWSYKGLDLDETYPALMVHDDDLDTIQGTTASTNNVPDTIYTRNFWHDRPHAEARRLNSVPNLYEANGGDLLTLEGSSVAASRRIVVTNHKFLVANPASLAE
jgi:hypothetical protein